MTDSALSRQAPPPSILVAPPGWLDNDSTTVDAMPPPSTAIVMCAVAPRRCQSAAGSISSSSTNNNDICRICHCEGSVDTPLIMPCYCSGTLMYVHQKCLQQWIKSSQTRSCEVCRYNFKMHSKLKPFCKWEKLNISSVERRKILCSITFHMIAITCVVWSLFVLIDKTTEEIQAGNLAWGFYTKLVVVAIGFAGGLVFMYVQCKMYVQLFRRWKAYNKVIYVQNCPEKGGGAEKTRQQQLMMRQQQSAAAAKAPPPPSTVGGSTAVVGDIAAAGRTVVTVEIKDSSLPATVAQSTGQGTDERPPTTTVLMPISSLHQPISPSSSMTETQHPRVQQPAPSVGDANVAVLSVDVAPSAS